MAQWHAVVAWSELPEGLTEIEVAGEFLLLTREADALHACAATCPHKFTPLSGGTLLDGCLTCPMHAASFDLSSGRPFPGNEWAGNLPVFPVRVTDGMVEIQV